jgi:hypothetical protein
MDPDVTRARHVLRLADEAVAQVRAAHGAADELLAAVTGASEPPSVAPAPVEAGLDAARLVAIEMAVAGRSREDVGRHVRASHEVGDVEALLDDVFGPLAVP